MKAVCCYVAKAGGVRDEAYAALRRHWGFENVDFVEIDPDDDHQYGRVLRSYWENGRGFMVVEPDIVIREDVVAAVPHCEYGAFPYAWRTNVGPALGCTWFHEEFLMSFPTAMREAVDTNVGWRQLDVVLMRHILARKYGQQPHVHLPAVEHLNEAKRLLPDADPTPLMRVPVPGEDSIGNLR